MKSGDVIGIIKNTADFESISELELRINDFTNGKGFALPNQSLKLGDLQPYYSTFLQTLKENNFLIFPKEDLHFALSLMLLWAYHILLNLLTKTCS